MTGEAELAGRALELRPRHGGILLTCLSKKRVFHLAVAEVVISTKNKGNETR
jgi:hypothetical protein